MIIYNGEDFVRFASSGQTKIIGVTSGCFDLLHPLHVEYLNKCRRECDELYVYIDSDKLVNENKNKVPLINEMDRAYMVDNLSSVSGVIIINELDDIVHLTNSISNGANLIRVFKHCSTIYGKDLISYMGNVETIIVPDIIRFQSTTEITNFLKQD